MAISYPITNSKISTTQWGIPVTDAINQMQPVVNALVGAWVVIPYEVGWSAYGSGFGVPSYRLEMNGKVVRLRGLVSRTGGAAPGNTAICVFPIAVRPLATVLTTTLADSGNTRVDLSTGGMLSITSPVNTGSFIALDGITWGLG